MKLIHCTKYSCTVKIKNSLYSICTAIDLNSDYHEAGKESRFDLFDCQHVEQSIDERWMYDFKDRDFYKLGKQLAKN